jgi:hypothetical protein
LQTLPSSSSYRNFSGGFHAEFDRR